MELTLTLATPDALCLRLLATHWDMTYEEAAIRAITAAAITVAAHDTGSPSQ